MRSIYEERETIEIVKKLNNEIHEIIGNKICNNEYPFEFIYMSSGDTESVEFLGMCIWSSIDDERNYVNENTPAEDYEPLEEFLKRESNKICKLISKLDFEHSEDN